MRATMRPTTGHASSNYRALYCNGCKVASPIGRLQRRPAACDGRPYPPGTVRPRGDGPCPGFAEIFAPPQLLDILSPIRRNALIALYAETPAPAPSTPKRQNQPKRPTRQTLLDTGPRSNLQIPYLLRPHLPPTPPRPSPVAGFFLSCPSVSAIFPPTLDTQRGNRWPSFRISLQPGRAR